ncbi:hypothetical protein [Actinomadura luteofluorescens]|uniref:hypothetical protein n=1 Tax=Actinomadura luteofluorescens TaxID=46163 RepID=UPI003D932672
MDPAWQNLAGLLKTRRVQLDVRYKNRRAFCDAKNLDYRVVSDIEGARRDNFSGPMLTALEVAYEIADGGIEQALADPDLKELPGRDTHPLRVPSDVSLRDLEPWERSIWLNPHLTDKEKEGAILLIRLQRGILKDDTEGLLRLSRALNQVVDGHLDRRGPLRAVRDDRAG